MANNATTSSADTKHQCFKCGEQFTPTDGEQKFACSKCRYCSVCGETDFAFDDAIVGYYRDDICQGCESRAAEIGCEILTKEALTDGTVGEKSPRN